MSRINFEDTELNQFRHLIEGTISELRKSHAEAILPKLARSCEYVYGMSVKGDIAEFGTQTARTAVMFATALRFLNETYKNDKEGRGNKKLWLFDSFQGLPESETDSVDAVSPHVASGTWAKGKCKGYNALQMEKIISQILNKETFEVIEGWFSESLENISSDNGFALVHVDCDLYRSTIDVLDNLFDKSMINNGCLILFDDFNCNMAAPEFGERRAWREMIEKYEIEYSSYGNYGPCCHAFLIHNYTGINR
jgi:hypothetical protein